MIKEVFSKPSSKIFCVRWVSGNPVHVKAINKQQVIDFYSAYGHYSLEIWECEKFEEYKSKYPKYYDNMHILDIMGD